MMQVRSVLVPAPVRERPDPAPGRPVVARVAPESAQTRITVIQAERARVRHEAFPRLKIAEPSALPPLPPKVPLPPFPP